KLVEGQEDRVGLDKGTGSLPHIVQGIVHVADDLNAGLVFPRGRSGSTFGGRHVYGGDAGVIDPAIEPKIRNAEDHGTFNQVITGFAHSPAKVLSKIAVHTEGVL